MGPELDAVIRRMLSANPEERGSAKELAEAMERSAAQVEPVTTEGLFEWETLKRSEWPREDVADAEQLGHRLRRRSREVVRLAVEADAAKRAGAKRQQTEALAKAAPRVEREVTRERAWSSLLLLTATAVAALLLWLQPREPVSPQEEPPVAQSAPAGEQKDGGVTYVGDTALSSAHSFEQPPMSKGVAVEAPPKPLPGQLKPDANGRCRKGQYVINGGCWLRVEVSDLEDCKGVRNGVEFEQACYAPIFSSAREPTSAPVKPAE